MLTFSKHKSQETPGLSSYLPFVLHLIQWMPSHYLCLFQLLCICHSTFAFNSTSLHLSISACSFSNFLSSNCQSSASQQRPLIPVLPLSLSLTCRSLHPVSWAHILLYLPLTAWVCSECFFSHFSLHSFSSFKVMKYISCYFWYSPSPQSNFSSPHSHSSLFGFSCEAQSERRATTSLSLLRPKQLWSHLPYHAALWVIPHMPQENQQKITMSGWKKKHIQNCWFKMFALFKRSQKEEEANGIYHHQDMYVLWISCVLIRFRGSDKLCHGRWTELLQSLITRREITSLHTKTNTHRSCTKGITHKDIRLHRYKHTDALTGEAGKSIGHLLETQGIGNIICFFSLLNYLLYVNLNSLPY